MKSESPVPFPDFRLDEGIPRLRSQRMVAEQFIRQRGLQRQANGEAYSTEPFHGYLSFFQ